MKTSKIIIVIYFLVSLFPAQAQDFPDPPSPPRLVNDYTGFLETNEIISLERKLVEFSRETSTQISIVIVPTLHGYDKSDYAFRLGEKWGIGQGDKDNGVLILIKPKTQNESGQAFIAIGYGLEGAIPDAIANRIVNAEILPNFKKGENYQGLEDATNRIISLAEGEFTADEYAESTDPGAGTSVGIIVIFFIIIIFSMISRAQRAKHFSGGKKIPFWTAFLLGSATGMSHRGSYGNFSSGSGSFGGFGGGGGGFGGFGGGGFGGGGAGGSW